MLRNRWFALFTLSFACFTLTLSAEDTEVASEKEELSKLSLAFGHFIGKNISKPGIPFDLDKVIEGIKEGAEGKPSPISDQEYQSLLMKYQEKAFKKVAEENLEKANAFLEKNIKEEGVKELKPNKLQILIVKEGTGEEVEEDNTPEIKYTGKLLDDQVFASSEDAGGSITIPLAQAIPGFKEGVLGMKEGEQRRLFIHPEMAYGTAGHLPPNSLLIFDIEVIKANVTPEDEDLEEDEDEDLGS